MRHTRVATLGRNRAPSLSLNFADGSNVLNSAITFTRASSGTRFDASGVLQTSATDAPRFDYDPATGALRGLLIEEARTNSLRNNSNTGMVLASATELSTNGDFALNPVNASADTIQNGWQWALNGGSGSVVYNSGTVQITGDGSNATVFDTNTALVSGAAYKIQVDVSGNSVVMTMGNARGGTNGLAAITLSPGTNTIGLSCLLSTWIRFSRTSAGTATLDNFSITAGGSLPTNWTQTQNTGCVPLVVASGTESGIPYMDLRFVTPQVLVGTNNNVILESTTQIAALTGQTWTGSAFVRLVGGSTTNASPKMLVSERDAAGVSVTFTTTTLAVVGTGLLGANRFTSTRVFSGGGTVACTTAQFQIVSVVGSPMDLTLRIGGVMHEQGAAASSLIQTSTVAVTRAVDVATITSGSLATGAYGTMYVKALKAAPSLSKAMSVLALINSTNKSSLNVSASNTVNMFDTLAPVNTSLGAEPTGTAFKAAYSFSNGQQWGCLNGGTPASATATGLLSSFTALNIGHASASQQFCGWLQEVKLFPFPMTSGEVKALSAP